MLARLHAHLTFANVVSFAALFIALSGGAYALTIPRNSVGAKQLKKSAVTRSKIKKGAVTSAKVKDRSLLATDLKAGQLPAGPQGPTGATGLKGSPGQGGSPDTPQQVLAKLTQVDGSGSGLGGDTIDGFDSAVLAKVVGELTLADFNFGPIAAGRCGQVSTNGLSGSLPGDFVLATPTNGDSIPGGFTFTGAGVQAASNGEARLCNHTAVDATSPTFDIRLVAIRL